jgi:hypothetical protein
MATKTSFGMASVSCVRSLSSTGRLACGGQEIELIVQHWSGRVRQLPLVYADDRMARRTDEHIGPLRVELKLEDVLSHNGRIEPIDIGQKE